MTEDKIIYIDGDRNRVLHGIIIDEDIDFITLKRNSGNIKIGKRSIVEIRKRSSEGINPDLESYKVKRW